MSSFPVTAQAAWNRLSTTIFTTVSREEDLPHPGIIAMAQDGDGFLWIGTQDGLARYDGYGLRTFLHRNDDPASLPGNFILALTTDTAGRLWVGTLTGDIARYDAATGQFVRVPPAAGAAVRGGVYRLVSDGAGGMWAGTANGLEHIDDHGASVRYLHAPETPGSLPDNRVISLLLARDGTLWVGTNGGLAQKAPGTDRFEPVPLFDAKGDHLSDMVSALLQDSDGDIWFGTFRSGAGSFVTEGGARGNILPGLGDDGLGKQMVVSLAEGRRNEIWIGRSAGGIAVHDKTDGSIRLIRRDPGDRFSLPDDLVREMLRDRSGVMWVAGNRGLSRTNLADDAVETILPRASTDGLPGDDVMAIGAAPGAEAWLGFRDKGVAELNPVAGTVRPLSPAPGVPTGVVTGLAGDDDGRIWLLGSDGHSLCRYDPVTGTAWQRPLPAGVVGFGGHALRWFQGDLWLAASVLIHYDPRNDAFQVFRHTEDPTSIADEPTDVVLAPEGGGLWVATRHGLDYLDLDRGTFRHVVHDEADPRSLPANLVSSLLADRRGRIWVATLGGGIGMMDPVRMGEGETKVTFHHVGKTDGLPSDSIGSLLEDDSGRIWASTTAGLAVIDPDRFTARPLGLGDGVAISAYWTRSAAKLTDGTLLFGGIGGLSVVHPDRLVDWTYRAPVVIDAVRVDGRLVEAAPNGRTSVVLKPDERKLDVDFAALDFSAPNRLRYAYKLEGFDKEWIDADGRHVATYTNLPPGGYRLLIKGSNRVGTWSDPIALPVEVTPAWWQTLWFRLFAAAMVLLGVWLLVQARTAFLRRQRARLEDLVARQTEDLRAANLRLEELASRDGLTGLLNRRAFFEQAERDMERAHRSGRRLAVLMIDIDHFKTVNDTWGHAAGDAVLRSVANHVNALLRDTDLFARWGGEELLILMPETDQCAAMAVAERLRAAVADGRHEIPNGVVPVTVSIGLAVHSDKTETLKACIEKADQALYAAKNGGRNRVVDASRLPVDPPTD